MAENMDMTAVQVGELQERRQMIAALRLARACYNAQWEDGFDDLSPNGIERALAMEVGYAALNEMNSLVSEWKATDDHAALPL